jgi:integrase
MASLEQRGNRFRVVFRYAGEKYSRSLRTKDEKAANASLARLEDNLRRLELGTLMPPDDVDLAEFLISDGRMSHNRRRSEIRRLDKLFDAYVSSLPNGSVEDNTLDSMNIHIKHLTRIFGGRFRTNTLQLADLQRYVEERSKEKGLRGKTVCATTIKKELGTFSAIWKWARRADHVKVDFPNEGLKYPKEKEKPPFQTWIEIERKIARGGLSEAEEAELWDCLFLTLPEIDELLGHVKSTARQPFLYPMVVFAAHTGARRSEMMRSEVDDIDFDSQTAVIREKKRVRGRLSTRRVPLSPLLLTVIRDWLDSHPSGKHTFCLDCSVRQGGKTREIGAPLTRDEAHDHFKRTLAGSKWEKIRGWHIFRHSFCSNCAAKGIDQRIINAWVGHQTEEMVRRYRHLIPNQQQEAIRLVFGNA